MALQAARAFLVLHIRACLNAFDPLIIAPSIVKTQSDLEQYRQTWSPAENAKYFVLPCLLYIIYFIDCGWVMYKYDFEYNTDGMPELFNHKLFPAIFWEQTDVICVAAIACCVIVFYNLWRGAWLENRYCMYLIKSEHKPSQKLIVNGKVWNKQNAREIVLFQKESRRLMKIVYILTGMVIYAYFYYHALDHPWTDGWRDYVTYIIYYPPFLWYCPFGIIYLFVNFFLIIKYILIKQKHMIERLQKLIWRVHNSKQTSSDFMRLRQEFGAINSDLAYQCAEIHGYNKFWSVHLTAQFGCCAVLTCYCIFCLLYLKSYSISQIVYFVFFPFQLGLAIFMVIYRCSLVDANNERFYLLNMKACMGFQFCFAGAPLKQRINIEKLGTNTTFNQCCFRLVNGYRLDSTAFNLAIYVISTLFMKIVKSNYIY